jgi:hypothetical protein
MILKIKCQTCFIYINLEYNYNKTTIKINIIRFKIYKPSLSKLAKVYQLDIFQYT